MLRFIVTQLQLQDRNIGDETQYRDAGKLALIIFLFDTLIVYLFALSGTAFSQFSLTHINDV